MGERVRHLSNGLVAPCQHGPAEEGIKFVAKKTRKKGKSSVDGVGGLQCGGLYACKAHGQEGSDGAAVCVRLVCWDVSVCGQPAEMPADTHPPHKVHSWTHARPVSSSQLCRTASWSCLPCLSMPS